MLWVWWLVSLRVGCPGLVFWVAVVVFLAVVTVARWFEECVAVYRLVWTSGRKIALAFRFGMMDQS